MGFKKALIVDDSKLARVTLKKKLEAHGLDVHVVDSAEQAYACLHDVAPDIIFMDHLMPGTDGFEATRFIRTLPDFAEIPIVMCTGKDHDGYLQEALAIGASFILSKPPVDEALDAILATDLSTNAAPALDADVTDFMSGHDELAGHPVPETPDLTPVPETAVADFMAESVEQVSQPAGAMSQVFSPAEIEQVCRQIMADERAIIINHVLSAIPAPVIPQPALPAAGIDAAQVAQICESIIAAERTAIIHDALAAMPEPVMAETAVAGGSIDMESVLSTVNATVNHQLAVNSTAIKASVAEQVLHDVDSLVSERLAEMIGRDMQDVVDLRLSVMLAEKLADTTKRLALLEQQLGEKNQLMNSSADLFSSDSPVKLMQRNDVTDKISDLYEKFISLQFKLKVSQAISVAAVGVAISAIVLGLR